MKKSTLLSLIAKPAGVFVLVYAASLNLLFVTEAASAEAKVVLTAPNLEMRFRSMEAAAATPKLAETEFAVFKPLRPFLTAKKYQAALAQLNEKWPVGASAALLYIRAQLSTQVGDYQSAEKDYLDSIAKHGEYLMAIQSLAGLALVQEQVDVAEKRLIQAINLGGYTSELFGQLAYVHLQNGRSFSAVAAYQTAYSLAPENTHWQQGLLLALSRSGATQQADSLVSELLVSSPSSSDLWLHKANAAMQGKNSSGALAAMEVAIRLGNNVPDNIVLASRLHLEHGNVRRAIELILNTASDEKSLLARYEIVGPMLSWLSSRGEWAKVGKLLSYLPAFEKNYSGVDRSHYYTIKAKMSSHRKRGSDAKKSLIQAIKINPLNAEALILLADIYEAELQLNKADLLLTRASTDDVHGENAILRRARIAYVQQQYDLALTLMQTLMSKNPSRSDLIASVNILRRLVLHQS